MVSVISSAFQCLQNGMLFHLESFQVPLFIVCLQRSFFAVVGSLQKKTCSHTYMVLPLLWADPNVAGSNWAVEWNCVGFSRAIFLLDTCDNCATRIERNPVLSIDTVIKFDLRNELV